MASKDVTIYGAGMSGLIAAINLAREGYEVTIHDIEDGYGGSKIYNPSTHACPLDVKTTSEYLGIDIAPAFDPLLNCAVYFHDTKMNAPTKNVYIVERGDRPTSLDTLLMNEIDKLNNINFVWNSPLTPEIIANMPENTIVACGLIPDAYDMMEIPWLQFNGWISQGEIGIKSHAWLWWDEAMTEYGYISVANNYYFNLFFSIKEIPESSLRKYQDFMWRMEGIEHKSWKYLHGAVPMGVPDNPRLFWKNAVLAGTISGIMDPMMWFGIPGALVGGKVAATAIMDKEKGQREFDRFVKYYKLGFFLKNRLWYPFIRPNVNMLEKSVLFTNPHIFTKLLSLMPDLPLPQTSIPGFHYVGLRKL